MECHGHCTKEKEKWLSRHTDRHCNNDSFHDKRSSNAWQRETVCDQARKAQAFMINNQALRGFGTLQEKRTRAAFTIKDQAAR